MDEQKCFICKTTDDDTVSFFSYTTLEGESLTISEMFYRIVPEAKPDQGSSSDNGTKLVCVGCVLSLKHAYVVQGMCALSEEQKNKYVLKRFDVPKRAPNNDEDWNSRFEYRCAFKQPRVMIYKQFRIEGRLLKCNMCNYTLRNAKTLMQHLIAFHSPYFWCDKCIKSFTTGYEWDIHKRLHSGELNADPTRKTSCTVTRRSLRNRNRANVNE